MKVIVQCTYFAALNIIGSYSKLLLHSIQILTKIQLGMWGQNLTKERHMHIVRHMITPKWNLSKMWSQLLLNLRQNFSKRELDIGRR